MRNERIFMRLVTTSRLPKLINLFNVYAYLLELPRSGFILSPAKVLHQR